MLNESRSAGLPNLSEHDKLMELANIAAENGLNPVAALPYLKVAMNNTDKLRELNGILPNDIFVVDQWRPLISSGLSIEDIRSIGIRITNNMAKLITAGVSVDIAVRLFDEAVQEITNADPD